MSPEMNSEEEYRPTHTVENYLMTMYVMERDFGEIVAARLAEMMRVSPATVAMTLKRMKRDQWITGTGRKSIHLTTTGRAAAHSVIRRHMLIEWLLVRILKIPLAETHDEAHGIEHAISTQIEERMREILGDPQVCPHGNPFPGAEDVVSMWVPITILPVGEEVVIRRVHEFAEDDPKLLRFLSENGIQPAAHAQVVEILPFNQTLTLNIDGKDVTLGIPIAGYIYAERAVIDKRNETK